jgi:hypothetical protein
MPAGRSPGCPIRQAEVPITRRRRRRRRLKLNMRVKT